MFIDQYSNLKLYWASSLFLGGFGFLALEGLTKELGIFQGFIAWIIVAFIFILMYFIIRKIESKDKQLLVKIASAGLVAKLIGVIYKLIKRIYGK